MATDKKSNFADSFFSNIEDDPYSLLPSSIKRRKEFEMLKSVSGDAPAAGKLVSTPATSSSKMTQYGDFESKMSKWERMLKAYSEGN